MFSLTMFFVAIIFIFIIPMIRIRNKGVRTDRIVGPTGLVSSLDQLVQQYALRPEDLGSSPGRGGFLFGAGFLEP